MATDTGVGPVPPAAGTAEATLLLVMAAAAIAAFFWAVVTIVRRRRAGIPLVPPRPHEPVPWTGADVAFVALVHFCLAVFAAESRPDDAGTGTGLVLGMLATLVGTAFGLAWLAARGGTAADFGFVVGRRGEDLRLAAAGLALVVAPLLACAALLDRIVPYEHPLVEFLATHHDATSVTLVVLAAVVVAPLVEEIFFRRVLQGWLEKRFPGDDGGMAVGLASAAFAAAHAGQGLAFLPLFPLAVVLGRLASRTGSIVPCVLLHALFNAVSVGLLLVQLRGAGPTS